MFRLPACLKSALALLPFLAACGGGGGGGEEGPPTSPNPPPTSGDLAPLGVGDRWVYRHEDGRLLAVQVAGTRDVQGQLALVVQDVDLDLTRVEETLLLKRDDGLVELPDANDPASVALGPLATLKLPALEGERHVLVDRSVSAGYDLDEDGRPDAMRLQATQTVLAPETVSVPAGQFVGATHVQIVLELDATLSSGGAVRSVTTVHQWLAPGVGIVRETTDTVVGEQRVAFSRALVSYRVAGVRSESVGPTVIGATPAAGAVVGLTGTLQVQFNEPVAVESLNAGGLVLRRANGEQVAGTWTASGAPATFYIAIPGLSTGRYTVALDNRATDYLGNPALPSSWTFDVDISGPSVISSVPAHRANEVPRTQTITLTFDEALNVATVNSNNIRLTDTRGTPVAATVTALDARTVQIQPRAELAVGGSYMVSIGSDLLDARGNAATTATPLSFNTVQGLLSYPQTLPGPALHPVAAADIDGDGRRDVLGWTVLEPPTLDVRLQKADGSFDLSRNAPLPDRGGCFRPYGLAVADMNGDGRPDLVFASSCGVELILQAADRQFSERILIPAEQVSRIQVVDLDGDGRLDIVGSAPSHLGVTVWRQGAGFTFGAAQSVELFSNGFGDFAIGDLNGDGRADLVATSGQGDLDRALGITYQQADGSFAPPQYRRLSGGVGQTPAVIADLDGDGRQDLLVDDPVLETVSWFRQAADGTLEAPREIGSTQESAQLVVTDLDGNGRADLVAWLPGSPSLVLVHLQAADGSFAPRLSFRGPEGEFSTRAIEATDLNADGLPELLFPGPRIAFNGGAQAIGSRAPVRRGALGRAAASAAAGLSLSPMTPR